MSTFMTPCRFSTGKCRKLTIVRNEKDAVEQRHPLQRPQPVTPPELLGGRSAIFHQNIFSSGVSSLQASSEASAICKEILKNNTAENKVNDCELVSLELSRHQDVLDSIECELSAEFDKHAKQTNEIVNGFFSVDKPIIEAENAKACGANHVLANSLPKEKRKLEVRLTIESDPPSTPLWMMTTGGISSPKRKLEVRLTIESDCPSTPCCMMCDQHSYPDPICLTCRANQISDYSL